MGSRSEKGARLECGEGETVNNFSPCQQRGLMREIIIKINLNSILKTTQWFTGTFGINFNFNVQYFARHKL